MKKADEITDILTLKGIDKLKEGQILIFNNDNKRIELKITKLDKKKHRAWARPVITYRSDEIVVKTGKKRETVREYLEGRK